MKWMLQIGSLFLFCMVGEVIASLLPFPVPAGVLCMVLLFLGFLLKIVKAEPLKPCADVLLRYMPLSFLPATVGIMRYYDLIRSVLGQILLICVVSTLVTFAVTAYTVRLVTALQNRVRKGGKDHA